MNLQHFGLASLPLYVAWFCRLDFGWHVLMFSKYFRRRRHLPFMILANFIKMWQSSGPEMLKIDVVEFFPILPAGFWVTRPYVFKVFSAAPTSPYMIVANFIKMWQSSGPEMSKIDVLELFRISPAGFWVTRPYVFKVFSAALRPRPLWFC